MQFSFDNGFIHIHQEQQDPNQQVVQLPIPGIVMAVVHRQRVMMFDIKALPGGAFMDQNFDEEGTEAMWTPETLRLSRGDKFTIYQTKQPFNIDAVNDPLLMSYMVALSTKMGYA